MAESRRESTNVDARRALGVRPGGLPPLRVYLEEPPLEDIPPSPTINYPPSPRSPTASRNVSIAVPASPTLEPSRRFRRPTINIKTKSVAPPSNRGLYETQKLLSHLLDKLEGREPAPDILERAAVSAREVGGKGKGKATRRVRIGHALANAAATAGSAGSALAGPSSAPTAPSRLGVGNEDYDDSVDLDEGDWDTEMTYDLVEQTKSLLVLAEKQGLDLFSDASEGGIPIIDTTPVKNKRKAGRFSSVTSPITSSKPTFPPLDTGNSPTSPRKSTSSAMNPITGPTLLTRILALLQILINVDCLHQTHLFRPLCPPNALQAACLDIASYLYSKSEIEAKIRIVGMVVDGFYGLGIGMAERICAWLEGRLGELLGRLAKERGGPSDKESVGWTDPFATGIAPGKVVPTFAISTDSTDSLPPPQVITPGWKRYSPTTPAFPFFPSADEIAGVLSTHSSRQVSTTSLQIASLIPRILLAITSTIDLASSKLTTIHRVHRLLALTLTAKPDSALDLLEIVARAPPTSRRTASEILATFYLEVMGHNAIARRLASTTYAAQRVKWETGQGRAFGEDEIENHHFIPWRVSAKDNPNGPSSTCTVCDSDLHGFSLKCTLCSEQRHVHCYHTASGVFGYDVVTLSSSDTAPLMAHVKFSRCVPRLDEQVLYGKSVRGDHISTERKVGQHDLALVNMFNLTLCAECHDPLWGQAAQAYACTNGCQRFFHPDCAERMNQAGRGECRYGRDVVIDEISASGSDPFTITVERLQATFNRDAASLILNEEDLDQRSFDEISVLYGAVWLQYQLVKNGITSSALRVLGMSKGDNDVLELKNVVKLYENYLKAHSHAASSASADYAHVLGLEQPLSQGYLFSDRYLAYCTALLRAPSNGEHPAPQQRQGSEGLLTPMDLPLPPESPMTETDPSSLGAYEMLPISIISQTLSSDLNIQDPTIAAIFLDQLRLTGLLTISSTQRITSNVVQSDKWCSFNLPLLMDSSPTVELLILCVEALLNDLDLTMNEQGLRLLSRRAWPSLLCSPYALERLGKAVIAWVMAEDETIHQVVKLYASKHKRLPGVRATAGSAKGNSSVSVYKDDRAKLLIGYAEPWLRALHDQDPALYAHIVYEQCKLAAGNAAVQDTSAIRASDEQLASRMAGIALERMTAMVDSGVIFSTLMDLLTAWLEDLGALADQDVIYRSLPRLLRYQLTSPRTQGLEDADPDIFALSRSTARNGPADLDRVCRWMRVLSFSGVEIPWPLLLELVDLQSSMRSSMEARLDLVIAVNANGAGIEPAAFPNVCARMAGGVFRELGSEAGRAPAQIESDLMGQSMLLVLRAYGVAIEDVGHTALGTEELQAKQPASLAKRRRMTSITAQFPLDTEMILSAAAVLTHHTFPGSIVLDFLWLLFTKATMVDNVDGFLHHTCTELYETIWPLMDTLVDRLCRARLLLRLLSVNPAPLERMIEEQLNSSPEECETARERLLTFILELADSTITSALPTSSWRAAAVGPILLLFKALLDPKELIPDNPIILKSLLPTQLAALSSCFEEYLVQSSDERRLVLITQLRRLRLVVPTWPILSWTVIESLLSEEIAAVTQLRPGRSSATISALHDAQMVRCGLLALGLDMLTSVPCTWITAQRFQQHVASACALPWSSPTEAITTLVLPSLRNAIDSPTRILISGHTFETKVKKTALIGALLVPVVIDFGSELLSYDYLTQRALLDILMITFFKQNVRPVELAALGALQTMAEFVSSCECAENRLLALQILQTAIVRMERDSVIRVVPSVFGTIAAVLVEETGSDHSDSAIIEQSRNFLRSITKSFGRSGLFLQLFRNDAIVNPSAEGDSSLARALQILYEADRPIEDSTGPSLFDSVFRDLSDVLKRGRQIVDQVLASLCRFTATVEVGLSDEAAQNFGAFILRLSKHVAEWDFSEFDPNPALRTCASVLRLINTSAAATLLHQTSTFLHLSLNRFDVNKVTIAKLLQESDRVSHLQGTEDTVRTVLFELAGSVMHGLTVTPMTLHTLLQFLAADAFPKRLSLSGKSTTHQARVLADSAPGCIQVLLRSHPAFAVGLMDSELSLGLAMQAGTVLCKAEMIVSGVISQSLGNMSSEAASTQVKLFISLLLASLEIPMSSARRRLIALYPLLARATSLCLRACADYLTMQDGTGAGAELLSLVFAVFRLAVLALEDPTSIGKGERQEENEDAMDTLWTRIWPDWYRLLVLSLEPTCINGPLRAVGHSVFLDTIIFLGSSQSPILMKHAGTLSHSLSMLVLHQENTSTTNVASQPSGKVQKAAQVLDKLGLGNRGDGKALVEAVKSDLAATEKLRALRAAVS